jgi:hypothetical protein
LPFNLSWFVPSLPAFVPSWFLFWPAGVLSFVQCQ